MLGPPTQNYGQLIATKENQSSMHNQCLIFLLLGHMNGSSLVYTDIHIVTFWSKYKQMNEFFEIHLKSMFCDKDDIYGIILLEIKVFVVLPWKVLKNWCLNLSDIFAHSHGRTLVHRITPTWLSRSHSTNFNCGSMRNCESVIKQLHCN